MPVPDEPARHVSASVVHERIVAWRAETSTEPQVDVSRAASPPNDAWCHVGTSPERCKRCRPERRKQLLRKAQEKLGAGIEGVFGKMGSLQWRIERLVRGKAVGEDRKAKRSPERAQSGQAGSFPSRSATLATGHAERTSHFVETWNLSQPSIEGREPSQPTTRSSLDDMASKLEACRPALSCRHVATQTCPSLRLHEIDYAALTPAHTRTSESAASVKLSRVPAPKLPDTPPSVAAGDAALLDSKAPCIQWMPSIDASPMFEHDAAAVFGRISPPSTDSFLDGHSMTATAADWEAFDVALPLPCASPHGGRKLGDWRLD